MPLISMLVYFVGGTLSLLLTAFFYFSYRRSGHRIQKYIAIIFFSVAMHAFAFAIPFLTQNPSSAAMGWGYIIGIMFVYIVFLYAIPVIAFLTPRSFVAENHQTFITLLTVLGAISLSVMIIDFRPPISSGSGFVIWNTNPISTWINGLSGMFIGSSWFFAFYRNSQLIRNRFLEIKMFIIGTVGFLLGIVAFLVYTSTHGFQTAVGHVLFLTACFLGLALYVIPKSFFSDTREKSGSKVP